MSRNIATKRPAFLDLEEEEQALAKKTLALYNMIITYENLNMSLNPKDFSYIEINNVEFLRSNTTRIRTTIENNKNKSKNRVR